MKEKSCYFVGYRYKWDIIGIEKNLLFILEELVNNGYTVFYDGGYSPFSAKAVEIILSLKKKYPHIKLIKVLNRNRLVKGAKLQKGFDASVYPDIEESGVQEIISKRKQWIVDNSDVIVCHIAQANKGETYKTVQYAEKENKTVIYI